MLGPRQQRPARSGDRSSTRAFPSRSRCRRAPARRAVADRRRAHLRAGRAGDGAGRRRSAAAPTTTASSATAPRPSRATPAIVALGAAGAVPARSPSRPAAATPARSTARAGSGAGDAATSASSATARTADQPAPTPVALPGGDSAAVAIAAGGRTPAPSIRPGEVFCWGATTAGSSAGRDGRRRRRRPRVVGAARAAAAVSRPAARTPAPLAGRHASAAGAPTTAASSATGRPSTAPTPAQVAGATRRPSRPARPTPARSTATATPAAGAPTPAASSATASTLTISAPAAGAPRLRLRPSQRARRGASLWGMRDRAEQTLTAVQSPLSPGEQKDRAVLLMVGSAEAPGAAGPRAPAVRRATTWTWAARADERRPANAAMLDDALVSGHHARITRGAGGYELVDLGSKNGTWVDNAARSSGKVRLRDGALVFFGNHVGRLPDGVGASSSRRSRPSWSRRWGRWRPPRPPLAVACDRLRRLAASDSELLILGETGVGKEVYARAVHAASGRKGRFVAINCARDPARAGRERAVRLPPGRALDRAPGQAGPHRGGRGRDAVPRRDRRDDAARRRSSSCASCRTAS